VTFGFEKHELTSSPQEAPAAAARNRL